MASGLLFGAIFGHFEPFWALLTPFLTPFGHLGGGQCSKWVRTPYSWGKMAWGVKIGGSRGPKCRLDPPLGPFLVILSHLGPFWAFFDLFWSFGCGAKTPSVPGPAKVGVKWGGESKLVGPEGPSAVKTHFWGHFWSFWALLGLFDPFWPFGWGQRLQVDPDPPKVGVKLGVESK